MLLNVFDLLLVLLAVGAVYVLVPALAARRLMPRESLAGAVAGLAVSAIAAQSLLGFLWGHAAPWGVRAEAAVYLAGWLAVALYVTIRAQRMDAVCATTAEARMLVLFLAAGGVLRAIHPLRTQALGQSDAYSHLQFLCDILGHGRLRHVLYPPGYHWMLALPTTIFRLDPYVMARYAGGFFGLLTVLVLYRLARQFGGQRQALWTAYLAACFPGALLLIKTGVGSFANQAGLLLLPAIFHEYLALIRGDGRRHIAPLLICLAGLAVSVPLMVVDVALVFLAERAITWACGERTWSRAVLWALGAAALAGGLIVFHLTTAGAEHLAPTVRMLTGREGGPDLLGAMRVVAVDFMRVKRVGFSATTLNLACVGFALLFAGVLTAGCHCRNRAWMVMATWGLLATLQTALGVLQFTAYQRAGWQLLLCAVWAGGLLIGAVHQAVEQVRWARSVLVGGAVVLGLVSFARPPAHAPHVSAAESEIVAVVRCLSYRELVQTGTAPPRTVSVPRCDALSAALADDNPVTVLARRFSGYQGNQGDPVHAARVHGSRLGIVSVGAGEAPPMLDRGVQYVVLIDDSLRAPGSGGAFARIDDAAARQLAATREELERANLTLRGLLATSRAAGWTTRKLRAGPPLEIHLLRLNPDP